MEKTIKKECLYVYNWVTLLYSRDWQNTVNQLYFNKKSVSVNNLEHKYHIQNLIKRNWTQYHSVLQICYMIIDFNY